MARPTQHTRILAFPYADSLSGARLDALLEEWHGRRRDLVIDYSELRLAAPPELLSCSGQPCEHVQGHYIPCRLRWIDVQWLKRTGVYTRLEEVPLDHAARSLRGALYLRPAGKVALWGLFNGSDAPADLRLSARRCEWEARVGLIEVVDLVRDWSPPPSLPPRLVPQPQQIHYRYGGDPITIRSGHRLYHRRLFVGGLSAQIDQRPSVDAVLNLGDNPSRWCTTSHVNSADRWDQKGEGKRGMTVAEIAGEAQWVIERLQSNQRVLVHCSAGLNRSVTICCAVLILLEGLSAEAALERVREHHPWSRPDAYHWLALRWLAQTGQAYQSGPGHRVA